MYTLDDSMFSLILRFIGHDKEIAFSDNEFIQKQLLAIKNHINEFPPEERESRTLEWIEQYASEYRKRWESDVVGENVSDHRCPDCPLAESNPDEHCSIHNKWLELLDQYITNEINTGRYVKSGLKLLAAHKDLLKVKLIEPEDN